MWRLKPYFQKCKKAISAILEKIPRKLQVLLNVLTIALLLFALYVFHGSPCFTPEQAYRRLEKANSVGPAQILGYESFVGYRTTQIVLAETENGVILSQVYPQSKHTFFANQFFYVEKRGDITITPTPQDLHWQIDDSEQCLTMVVFDEYPQAVRAELDFFIFWYAGIDRPNAYEETVHLESQRENEGYFRFDMPFTYDKYAVNPRAEAISQLSMVFYYPQDWTPPKDSYPATVRLYDAENNLIIEKDMQLFEQQQK